MAKYPAFIDGEAGAHGIAFPDLPGIVAMGETVDDALLNAEQALRDYVTETERDGVQVVDPSPIGRVSGCPSRQAPARCSGPPSHA